MVRDRLIGDFQLLKIIQNNALLDELTSCIEQNHNFQENLEILKPKDPVGSLSIYDEYFNKEYQTFRLLSTEMEEGAAYGSESFPSSFLGLLRKNVILQQEI
ncbi:12215_t:CDS:2 [Funneliformis geosporum]|nr:12215_t:CDS:2 [Funneliformis geosporum]